jgi:hypothetical protein
VQAKDEFAEVFILGQQKSVFIIRPLQKLCIGRSRRDFGCVDHIVSAAAKVTARALHRRATACALESAVNEPLASAKSLKASHLGRHHPHR